MLEATGQVPKTLPPAERTERMLYAEHLQAGRERLPPCQTGVLGAAADGVGIMCSLSGAMGASLESASRYFLKVI
jgi:hypothetical protein